MLSGIELVNHFKAIATKAAASGVVGTQGTLKKARVVDVYNHLYAHM